MSPLDALIEYAMRFVGKPYIWADKSPVLGGFDCSGLVCEILRPGGVIGNKEVLNAQQLFDKISHNGRLGAIGPGVVHFYGESVTKITHVAFGINSFQMIEAGGGDSTTLTEADADIKNAMVRMRLIDYRGMPVISVKPNYAKIGVVL